MTVMIQATAVCDLCGSVVSVSRHAVVSGWPQSDTPVENFKLNGVAALLCAECIEPLTLAMKGRVQQLRLSDKLVGFQTADTWFKRAGQ